MISAGKHRYICGLEGGTLEEIKIWDYGILLLLKGESRGVDTRFHKEALVMIIATVDSY